MGDWLQNLPVMWMTLVVFTLTYLVTWGIFAIVMSHTTGERTRSFKRDSPGSQQPLRLIIGL